MGMGNFNQEGRNMHYKNGREARNGDHILMISGNEVISGMLYGATPGNDMCNGYIAKMENGHYANLSECLHIDDVKLALTQVPIVPKEDPAHTATPK
jgi:hypothetical protein